MKGKVAILAATLASAAAASPALAQSGGGYEVTWHTIDGGGVMDATGGGYKAGGTIGQHDAGKLTGGTYAVNGGFWFATSVAPDPPITAIAPYDVDKNRFISFGLESAATAAAAGEMAIRVTLVELYHEGTPQTLGCDSVRCCAPRGPAGLSDLSEFNGEVRWVGPPSLYPETTAGDDDEFAAAQLQCDPYYADWTSLLSGMDEAVLNVFGPEIAPCSEYDVQTVTASCADESCYSAALTIQTAKWGDVKLPLHPTTTVQPDFQDIKALTDKFGMSNPELPSSDPPPYKAYTSLWQNLLDLNGLVSFLDIKGVADGFQQTTPYEADGPAHCP